MSLRATELQAIVTELNASLTGAFVQKAWSPLQRLAFLELRQPGRSVLLSLSAEPSFARLTIAQSRLPSPDEPPGFQRWLRQELIGAKLVAVDQWMSLVARLHFDAHGVPRVLVLDLRGSGANLVLLDHDGRVLAASVSEGDRTRPGAEWSPPALTHPMDLDAPSRVEPKPEAAFPISEAAEELFGTRERTRRAQEIRRRLENPLRAALQRLDRTREKVRAETDRTAQVERHRLFGELLSQNLYAVPRGAKSVTLTHYSERGVEQVEVPLDPKRSPKDEAERHFHQYRRLLNGMEHAKRRLAELDVERRELESRLESVAERTDDELLSNPELLIPPKKRGPSEGKPYKEFVAQNGARILVGRSSESNDELTFRIARPYDVWLHARGVPGSHVILEAVKNQEIHPEALLDAAHLAHHHSQQKNEPRGEIAWTQAKFVKKQKGGPPGAVTFTRDRSIALRVDASRIERLLKSQR